MPDRSSDPRRIIQMMDRVQEVLNNEFDDLTPADYCFGLALLIDAYCDTFVQIAEAKGMFAAIRKPKGR